MTSRSETSTRESSSYGAPRPNRRRSLNRVPVPSAIVIYLLLAFAALIMVLPFAFSFVTAFKSPQQFVSGSPLALPDPWTLESFAAVLGGRIDFAGAIRTTLATVVVLVIAQVGSSIFAAYAFARLRFPGREVIFWLFLSTMMIPATVIIIPLFLMMSDAGLKNTFWGIVLPFMFASPYAVFLLRENFKSIPQEIIDAAQIDGAGHLTILWRIVVPISTPIISTLTLITIVGQWNSFMWPRVIANQQPRVITVATATLQSQYNANWTYVMAATTLALVPLIALFLVFQKRIVSSIVLTGLK